MKGLEIYANFLPLNEFVSFFCTYKDCKSGVGCTSFFLFFESDIEIYLIRLEIHTHFTATVFSQKFRQINVSLKKVNVN